MKYSRVTRLQVGPPGQPGIEIAEHQIVFDILKDDTPKPNRATFTVYNLDDATHAQIERDDVALVFRAGHEEDEDEPGVLFVGAPYKTAREDQGPDHKTIIKSGDGKDLQKTTVSTKIKGRPNFIDGLFGVMGEITTNPEQTYRALRGSDQARQRIEDAAYRAPARDVLVRLSAANRFDWIVDGDQVVILSPGEALRLPAVVVSRGTGLVGYPKAVKLKSGLRGISCSVILDARHRVRRLIEVRGEGELDGLWQVNRIKATGDSGHGGAFTMQLDATSVDDLIRRAQARRRDVPGVGVLDAFETIAEVGLDALERRTGLPTHVFRRREDGKLVGVTELTARALEAAGYVPQGVIE